MPERAYANVEHAQPVPPAVVVPWAVHIPALAAIIAVALLFLFVPRWVNSLHDDVITNQEAVERISENQAQGKSRGCAMLAQQGGYFPNDCLDEPVLTIYGREVVDVLPRTSDPESIRARICRALKEQGTDDTDCV